MIWELIEAMWNAPLEAESVAAAVEQVTQSDAVGEFVEVLLYALSYIVA